MATIRKRGSKWQVQVRRRGCTPVSRSFNQKTDAERWARQVERDADRAGVVHDGRQLERITFAELIQRYRDTVTRQKRSADNERIFFGRLLRHPITNLRLAELTPAVVAAYRDERLRQVNTGSVLREMATMQHVLEVARREWGVPLLANPVAATRKPPPSPARTRRLQPGEAMALVAAIAGSRSPVIGPLFRLAIETGMRRSELVRMEWSHVNEDRRTLLITLTKNGHARTIPLSSTALAILGEVRGLHHARVFPTTANAVRLAWNRLRRRANVFDLRFHDLRHEAVSRYFERGLGMPEVALISGHRDPRMLMRYTHLSAELLARKLG